MDITSISSKRNLSSKAITHSLNRFAACFSGSLTPLCFLPGILRPISVRCYRPCDIGLPRKLLARAFPLQRDDESRRGGAQQHSATASAERDDHADEPCATGGRPWRRVSADDRTGRTERERRAGNIHRVFFLYVFLYVKWLLTDEVRLCDAVESTKFEKVRRFRLLNKVHCWP